MKHNKNQGPQFPVADYHSIRQGGAKNHWVNIGCGATNIGNIGNKDTKHHSVHNLNIGKYNVRTLLGKDRLLELENELDAIKWDIIELA